ncbi:MAG: phage tail protein [Sphingomonas bacterium]|jgi:phage tail protein X|nr:tail protein X [Sphingomonas bacterium]MDB5688554.1 phage tail protein [Sphingomonas bacterium]
MAAENVIRARQGDTLDGLLWRERGIGSAGLAVVLDANPGLAGMGAVLPVGTPVTVPVTTPAADALPLINLWD